MTLVRESLGAGQLEVGSGKKQACPFLGFLEPSPGFTSHHPSRRGGEWARLPRLGLCWSLVEQRFSPHKGKRVSRSRISRGTCLAVSRSNTRGQQPPLWGRGEGQILLPAIHLHWRLSVGGPTDSSCL